MTGLDRQILDTLQRLILLALQNSDTETAFEALHHYSSYIESMTVRIGLTVRHPIIQMPDNIPTA